MSRCLLRFGSIFLALATLFGLFQPVANAADAASYGDYSVTAFSFFTLPKAQDLANQLAAAGLSPSAVVADTGSNLNRAVQLAALASPSEIAQLASQYHANAEDLQDLISAGAALAKNQPFFDPDTVYQRNAFAADATTPCGSPGECASDVLGISTGLAGCFISSTGIGAIVGGAGCVAGVTGAYYFLCNLNDTLHKNCKAQLPPIATTSCIGQNQPNESACNLTTHADFGVYYLSDFVGCVNLSQDVSNTVPNQSATFCTDNYYYGETSYSETTLISNYGEDHQYYLKAHIHHLNYFQCTAKADGYFVIKSSSGVVSQSTDTTATGPLHSDCFN